jgi:HEAT repeat protein
MMLWWKYQQLRSGNMKTRLATIAQLAESKNKDSVKPLLFALKDKLGEVRGAAVLALGQFQDKQMVEPLIKMLGDPAPVVRATAAEVLSQLKETAAIPSLINLLRDPDATVRLRASKGLDRLDWQPESDIERTMHIVASGNLKHVTDLGSDAYEMLADMMRKGEPEKQLFAIRSLGEIADPRVPKLILEALNMDNVLIRLAALEILQQFADPANFEVAEHLLKDIEPNIRVAAIGTAVRCGGNRAVPALIAMLKDVSWEVRREAIKALGKLGNPEAIDGLAKALQDRDHDVRESAAVALGRMYDPRAIRPLVLALLDIESFVRSAASNSLKDINLHWDKTEEARSALPQINAARKHREYWISYSANCLIEQIQPDAPAETMAAPAAPRPETVPPLAMPAKRPPEIIGKPPKPPKPSRPTREVNLPAVTPVRPELSAFDILTELLGDRDRDLRLAAAEAFGQLRDKRAAVLLAPVIHDDDNFVRQAAERAQASLI